MDSNSTQVDNTTATMDNDSDASMRASAWLNDPDQVKQIKDLRTMALGNARLLYGNDRNHFYDVITTHFILGDKLNHGAFLVVTIDGASRALRKELSDNPIAAVQAIVAGLQNDTGLLFTKYDVGDAMRGQQGARNAAGVFELDESKALRKSIGAVDETKDMERQYAAPRGPRGWDRFSGKGGDRGGDRGEDRGSKREKLDY